MITVVQQSAQKSPIEKVEALRAVVSKLPVGNVDFASSLIAQFERKGFLSPNQWPWVEKLTALGEQGAPKPKSLGNVAEIYAMFAKAQEKLRFPKITLQLTQGSLLSLYVSGARSKQPGVVNVTMPSTEGKLWLGRVQKDGKFEPSLRADKATQEQVGKLLFRLAKDPQGVVKEFGKLTGHCSFCYRTLSDERSLNAGYGPVCAENFGLNWG